MKELIVTYVRGGAFDHVAARAAGIDPRTFRDWMARGEGRHPTREPTPALRDFAREVSRARAEARLGAEVRVYREKPAHWLSHAARSRPDEEGWTNSPGAGAPGQGPGGRDALSHLTDEELHDRLQMLQKASASTGDFWSPACPDRRCPCIWHREMNDRG